ncbi:MAG: oxalurate catabolism protein HpxZ [Methylophilus sp.]|nr:oxalurate catabolism protein HpxZ [Methylophilus sp.]
MMEVNIPEVLAEMRTVFAAYEDALNGNDVDALINFFWQSPHAVRYGANENLYGWDQIVNFRKNRTPPPARVLFNTVITTFGHDYANASTEFKRHDGVGRQSQSWIRCTDGWKIAAAHISFSPT